MEGILRNHRTPPPTTPAVQMGLPSEAGGAKKWEDNLRQQHLPYSWGYPVKLVVQRNGKTIILQTPDDGAKTLCSWSIELPTGAQGTQRLPPSWRKSKH
ncbi:Hypothetical predicted protein [Pelobates cultripes]|uniref:Uncharacterized protein n=1 Tax=Pelobates cultripes TaxID=61616 RepID=A0AAD1T6V3_PELCU|nr:Hypothetical predicted protein [Pelobates cultripes]